MWVEERGDTYNSTFCHWSSVFINLVDTLLYKLHGFPGEKKFHSSNSQIKMCLSIISTTVGESQAHRRLDYRICVADKKGVWRGLEKAFPEQNLGWKWERTWRRHECTVAKHIVATKQTTSSCGMYPAWKFNSLFSMGSYFSSQGASS